MAKFRSATLATTALTAAGFMAAIAAHNPVDAALFVRALVSTDGGSSFTTLGVAEDQVYPAPIPPAGPPAATPPFTVIDQNGGAGQISATFSGSGISVVVTSSFGSPLLPFPALSTTFNTTAFVTTATLLRIEFAQTDVPTSSGTQLTSGYSVTNLSGVTSVDESTWINRNNVPFSAGTQLGSTASFASVSAGVNSTDSFNSGNPLYSELLRVDILFPVSNAFVPSFAGGSMGITAAVPEPMSMALLGAGLLGLGIARRRRG